MGALAVLVVCGLPSSGKSTLCSYLRKKLQKLHDQLSDNDVHHRDDSKDSGRSLADTVVVVEESMLLHGVRDDWYADPGSEKKLRDAIRSTLERYCCLQNKVVIVDAQNSIKGFRYELYCIARAAGVRYCMVRNT